MGQSLTIVVGLSDYFGFTTLNWKLLLHDYIGEAKVRQELGRCEEFFGSEVADFCLGLSTIFAKVEYCRGVH